MKQLLLSHTSIYQTNNEEQRVTVDAKENKQLVTFFLCSSIKCFCRFVQTKDDFSLKINYHLLQKEVSKILLFSK